MDLTKKIEDYMSYDPATGHIVWIKKPSRPAKVGALAGQFSTEGYRQIQFNGKIYSAHRLAWYLYYGVWPKCEIDHINGGRADNRIANLREVTRSENCLNQKCHRAGRLAGIHFQGKKWIARVPRNYLNYPGPRKYLGSFGTQDLAYAALIAFCTKDAQK